MSSDNIFTIFFFFLVGITNSFLFNESIFPYHIYIYILCLWIAWGLFEREGVEVGHQINELVSILLV